MKNLNPFAFLKGELVDVHHPDISSGINENCICTDLNCNETLIARKGKRKVHHFSHKNNTKCNGLETALHLKSKEVIENLNELFIPGYSVFPGDVFDLLKDDILKIEADYKYSLNPSLILNHLLFTVFNFDDYKLFDERSIDLNNYIIESEVILEGMVPDIKLTNKKTNKVFFIEIAVTSFIKEEKKKLIKEKDLSVLEVDLSGFYKSHYNFDRTSDLTSFLQILFKKDWSYNSKDFSKYSMVNYKWVNVKNVNQLIQNRRSDFVSKFQNTLSVWYRFYNDELMEFFNTRHEIILSKTGKELVKDINYYDYDDEYNVIEKLMTPKIMEHLKGQYLSSEVAKKSEEEVRGRGENSESVQDFIKRMTF